MKRTYTTLFAALMLMLLASCGLAPEDDTDLPNWLDKKILAVQDSNYSPPIESIWQYDYKDKPVYLFYEAGDDTYRILYNRFGLEIGRSGGFGGTVTGVFSDFWAVRENPMLIWNCRGEY